MATQANQLDRTESKPDDNRYDDPVLAEKGSIDASTVVCTAEDVRPLLMSNFGSAKYADSASFKSNHRMIALGRGQILASCPS